MSGEVDGIRPRRGDGLGEVGIALSLNPFERERVELETSGGGEELRSDSFDVRVALILQEDGYAARTQALREFRGGQPLHEIVSDHACVAA